MTETGSRAGRASARPAATRVIGPGGIAYWLSAVLAVAAAGSSLLTFLAPDVLRGTTVMNGSARGTALVVLLAGVPVLACSMVLAARGSARAVLAWLGAVAFLLYNSLMFVFATPVNRLFLVYLAMLSLSAWSAGALLWQADVPALGRLFSPRAPAPAVAVYIWAVVALNAAAWLARIIPSLDGTGAPAYLRGTGMATNVVYVQDLALWLPLLAVAAAWLRQRRPWGYLLAGGGLVMWVLESISIAVDQLYGHAADPASPVASATLVPVFAILALVGLVPLGFLLRSLSAGPPGVTSGLRVPVAGRRTWPAWILAAVTLTVGAGAVFGGVQLLRGGFGMPVSWLSNTPFTGWAVPGVALLIGVAVPQLAVAALITASSRRALAAGYLAGLVLVAWIVVQLLVLQRYFFLQPVIACLGIAEVLLARTWQRAGAATHRRS